MGDVGFWIIVGHTILVTCTGDVTALFISSILQASAGLSCVEKITIFFQTGPFVDNVLFKVWWDFVFGVHKDGFIGDASFEDDLTLECQEILLNSSLRLKMYETEMKIFLLTSKPILGCMVGVVGFFSKFLKIQSW